MSEASNRSAQSQSAPLPAAQAFDYKDYREHVWKYFDRHAEQRLKTMNFYILLAAGILTVTAALARDTTFSTAWPFPFLLAFVSFIFWKLEKRNRDLVWLSEHALKAIEDTFELPNDCDGKPHRLKLFHRQEAELEEKQNGPSGNAYFTYSKCFNWLFLAFGWGGFLVGVVMLWIKHDLPRPAF